MFDFAQISSMKIRRLGSRIDCRRRQRVPGGGLGLTIAREIVSRAGGDIRITNREERGLVQRFELPLCG